MSPEKTDLTDFSPCEAKNSARLFVPVYSLNSPEEQFSLPGIKHYLTRFTTHFLLRTMRKPTRHLRALRPSTAI